MTKIFEHWRFQLISLPVLLANLMGPVARGQEQDSPADSGRLRVGYFIDRKNQVGPETIRSALASWSRTIAANRSDRVTTKVENDPDKWYQSIISGSHDLYGLHAYQYLALEDESLLRPALMIEGNHGATAIFLLVTRREDQIKSLRDLRESKILVDTGGFGALPLIWLETEIGAFTPAAEVKNFATVTAVQTAPRAFLPVYFGQADACVITQSAFTAASALNPDVATKLHPTPKTKSKPLLVSIFAFAKDYSIVDAEKISSKALENSASQEAQGLLDMVQRSGLSRYDSSALLTNRDLFKKYKALFVSEQPEAEEPASKQSTAAP